MAEVVAQEKITRTLIGVAFVDGVAQCDDAPALAYFERLGMTVLREEKHPNIDWLKADLLAYAADLELDVTDDNTKPEILEAINAAWDRR